MNESTTPQDGKAMPPASAGSVAGKPAAFRVDVDGIGSMMPICRDWAEVRGICDKFGERVRGVAPLYEHPWVTCAEREAITTAMDYMTAMGCSNTIAQRTIAAFLERIG